MNLQTRPQAACARSAARLALAHRSRPPARAAQTTCRAQLVSGECYEDIIDSLARRAIARATSTSPPHRVIVGVAGAPGSGKSTLASAVMDRINQLQPPARPSSSASGGRSGSSSSSGGGGGGGGGPFAVVLPMDGFHYYRRELDAMPDPQAAHARRGAPWTFDAAKFVAAVGRVRDGGAGGEVRVPSFDHGVGDPVEEDIAIPPLPAAAVVLVEGNYVLLEEEPWRQLRGLFDESWFVDCPLDVAMDRVFRRQTAIGLAPEVSRVRIASNDRPNAELVAACAPAATLRVPSTVPFRSSGSSSGGESSRSSSSSGSSSGSE